MCNNNKEEDKFMIEGEGDPTFDMKGGRGHPSIWEPLPTKISKKEERNILVMHL